MISRNIVFISKATPEDDEFVLWLAPKLEAAGYQVFADILSLKAGDRWRKEVTAALRDKAVKMLLCCTDTSLEKDGVQEEIGIALDLAKELDDKRFIIPLRLEKFKKIFGIGELQYINFSGSWANGLYNLLEELNEQKVPKIQGNISINPNWEVYKQRFSATVQKKEEVLTTNWIKILNFPKTINYYEPKGAIDFEALKHTCKASDFPAEIHNQGVFSFMEQSEIDILMSNVGLFQKKYSYKTYDFIYEGAEKPKIEARESGNMVSSMLRQSWDLFCREKVFTEYAYSNQLGFHFNKDMVPIKKRITWNKERRRSSSLRGISKNKVWEYGVTAIVAFWPFPHLKFKARVLFSEVEITKNETGNAIQEAGNIIDDSDKQHKFRRSVCSSWRNKQWHGRLMAFLTLLRENKNTLVIPVSSNSCLELLAHPITVNAPVTTKLPDILDEEDEETDMTTLGSCDIEEDDL